MANMYWATSYTGGLSGALDAIDPQDASGDSTNIPLAAGDACLVIASSGANLYVLQDSAGAVEDGVEVIKPDSNPGNLWWKRVQLGVPSNICVPFLGTTVPAGWTSLIGTHTPGALIKKL